VLARTLESAPATEELGDDIAAVEGSAEAHVGRALRGHEQMSHDREEVG
jgi:hypothetical protein